MLNAGGFKIDVKIQRRASGFRGIGRDRIMPCLSQFLSQPEINRLARKRGGRHLGAHCSSPQVLIRIVWQRQMEILHAFYCATFGWHGQCHNSLPSGTYAERLFDTRNSGEPRKMDEQRAIKTLLHV